MEITEQPQSRFRFRYKSEMVGTHGQLKAEGADKSRPIFPTVKVCLITQTFFLFFEIKNKLLKTICYFSKSF